MKELQSSLQMSDKHIHRLVTIRPGIGGLAGLRRDKLILFDAL